MDTCAAAFGFMEEESAALPVIYNYDLVVIDEISQMEGWQTDKILRVWNMSDRVPSLVSLGQMADARFRRCAAVTDCDVEAKYVLYDAASAISLQGSKFRCYLESDQNKQAMQ